MTNPSQQVMIDPINPIPIPWQLKNSAQWVTWQAGPLQSSGKFAKYPVHPQKLYKLDAHQSTNQMSFDSAMMAMQSNKGISGVGYVMSGGILNHSAHGEALYLVGIDIDEKAGLSNAQLHNIWINLSKPYVEVSPSKKGIRMFCLSKELVLNRNQNGLEMYSSGRFLTVTGWSGKGQLKECTDAVNKLHTAWFGSPEIRIRKTAPIITSSQPETPRTIAWAEEVLGYINPDCDYEQYRNVIWGIQALGWVCGESLQRHWSLGAPHRFTEDGLTVIQSSFDGRLGGITFGTVVHYAKLNGYVSAPKSASPNLLAGLL